MSGSDPCWLLAGAEKAANWFQDGVRIGVETHFPVDSNGWYVIVEHMLLGVILWRLCLSSGTRRSNGD